MKIRIETINPFFSYFSVLKTGRFDKYAVLGLLDHPDFEMEFKRYKNRPEESVVTKEDFIQVLHSLADNTVTLDKKVNRERKEVLQLFINNIEEMEERWKSFHMDDEGTIEAALQIAQKGLPDSINSEEIELLFTISIGNSFGWAYENVVHFDVVQLCRMYSSLEEMKYFLAHEIHHLGFTQFLKNNETSDESLIFLHFMAYEGLALKYCNFPNGNLLSQCLDEKNQNNTIWEDDWEYFKENSAYYLELFVQDYKDLKSQNVSINDVIFSHWKTDSRLDDKEGFNQYPNYFVGSEVFGVLIDDYGLDTVYEILSGQQEFVNLFNKSMEKRKLHYSI